MINMRPVANLGEKATILSNLIRPLFGWLWLRENQSVAKLPQFVPNDLERALFWTMLQGGYLFRDPIISLHLYYFTTPRLHHSPFKTRVDVVDAQFIITLFLGPETWVNACEIPYPFTLSCIIIILRIFAGRKCCVCDQHIHSWQSCVENHIDLPSASDQHYRRFSTISPLIRSW